MYHQLNFGILKDMMEKNILEDYVFKAGYYEQTALNSL